MLGLLIAGIVLGSVALVIGQNRRRPSERPVRIEAKDRKDPRRS